MRESTYTARYCCIISSTAFLSLCSVRLVTPPASESTSIATYLPRSAVFEAHANVGSRPLYAPRTTYRLLFSGSILFY